MKHLKTFESHSLETNEGLKDIGDTVKKFATGYKNKAEKDKAVKEFNITLNKLEAESKKNKDVVFNRKGLEKRAKDNKYRGELKKVKSAKDGKMHVVFDVKNTKFQDLASGASHSIHR